MVHFDLGSVDSDVVVVALHIAMVCSKNCFVYALPLRLLWVLITYQIDQQMIKSESPNGIPGYFVPSPFPFKANSEQGGSV